MSLKLSNRKLIGIGTSLLLTLPQEWTLHHNLKKNDLIELAITDDEEGRQLILKKCSRQN